MDNRWIGSHGIGRFASEIYQRSNFETLRMCGAPLDIRDPLRLYIALSRSKPNHFFSPGFNAPFGKPCSFSLTIHDLIHLEIKEEGSPLKRLYYKHIVLPAVHNADIVFTVSDFSRRKISDWAGISLDRVINVGNGVNRIFSPDGERFERLRPYLLYVGNQKPHKNVEAMITAYSLSNLFPDIDLLITGYMTASVKATVAKYGLEGNVVELGLVPEQELPKLYRTALAVVMPSRYEGFGLPVIEGMASGVPVLCSNRTSLPEVGGNAVGYFDPDDLESIADQFNALLDTDFRMRLSLSGVERAKIFKWDSVAAKVINAISEIM